MVMGGVIAVVAFAALFAALVARCVTHRGGGGEEHMVQMGGPATHQPSRTRRRTPRRRQWTCTRTRTPRQGGYRDQALDRR